VVASLIFARGGEIFENGEFAYDSVEAADAMSFYQDLAAKGCILPIAEKYGDQTDFGNGKILFSQGSSSGLPFYKSSIDDGEVGGFEWSVTAIPYTGDHPVQNVYGGSMSIVRTSPEEQLAAWVFLKYFTSAEIQARWAVASNYFPVRQSTAAELGDYIDNNEPYKTAFELLQYGKSEAAVAGYDNVRDAVEEAFIDMLFNGADIAGTLADLDAQANEIMYEAAPDGATRPVTPVAPTESAAPDYDTALYGNIEELDVAGTEITFWHRYDSGSRQEETDKIIADFNASNEYGITVIGSAEGHYGQIYDKMIAALTTGDVPDLVVAYQNQAAAFQVADGLVSIDPYINSATFGLDDADRGDFFAAFLESDHLPQFEGAAYGFPPGRSMEMMYYNKDWLAELGYDAPPTTPEEFGEMVCAAAEQPFSKNESDFSAGMELDTDASVVASLIFARGGEIFEDGEFNYDSPEALDAMSFYQGLADQGCILPIAE
ncbi:MAG: extracellular solute-binding protein, partial [Methylococcales bacterium]|nr:extracellular solute-binding protein [Methylococcales bacterium]